MKIKRKYIFAFIAMALGLASCSDDTWISQIDSEGTLSLVAMDVDVQTAEKLLSRNDESVDVSGFTVEIVRDDKTVKSWIYSAMPEIISLPVGAYTAKVYSHKVDKQGWDAPYYLGSKKFEIEKNKITKIGTVVCSFASLKVSIVYTGDLKPHLTDDCKVTVTANDDGTLDFLASETRSGYFEALEESNTVVATFTGTVDGNYYNITTNYKNILPGTHLTITYSANENNTIIVDEFGNIETNGINVDSQATDANKGGNIDIEEEVIDNPGDRPGTEESEEPEPDKPDVPDNPADSPISFTSSLSFENPNSVEVESAVVLIHADKGFAHLNVNIDSDNQGFLDSAGELMPLEFDLATVTDDTAESLESIGLPVGPYPADQTDITFDISDLVGLLGAFPGTHSFGLTVVDNEGNEKSITLKFIAE